MPRQYPSVELDPQHNSCVGGRTIITCPDCAGNAPRTSATICETCQGRGFNVFVCAHCNPALAEALREAEKKEEEIRKAVSASAADAAARSGDPTSSASRMGPHWRRFGDGGGGGGAGGGSGGGTSGIGGGGGGSGVGGGMGV